MEGWADEQNEHILIDDPVSSLDDNNVFITARLILELFEKHSDSRKVILTTHHMGLFSILYDWLSKGENASKFKVKRRVERQRADGKIEVKEVEENKYMVRFLERDGNSFHLRGRKKGTVLYHLLLLQIINDADLNDELHTYHFVLLRQVLESIASFLGEGRFSYVLDKLSFKDANVKSDIINALSHERVYSQKLSPMGGDTKVLFRKVFKTLKDTFYFSI
ncbi:AAA family ATPase [Cyclobacterium xiamenense]|uniref:AAA family ATPase n=1 Tax=Cyclobacterium xiamenense TaxID=1297121 RepID=UPI0019D5D779|nr:AAA family ATPase [Cyclobacterium xiamenense]